MKNFSLPRAAFLLWFLNYTIFSFVGNYALGGRHSIFAFLVYSLVWVAVELIFLGLIEDIF
jgi:hypothetical protein